MYYQQSNNRRNSIDITHHNISRNFHRKRSNNLQIKCIGGNYMTQPSQATVQRMFDYLWKIGAIQRTIEKKEAKQ